MNIKKETITILAVILVASGIIILLPSWVSAVRVGNESTTFGEFLNQRDGLVTYRDIQNEDIDNDEIERNVIRSLIEDAVVRDELIRRGITDESVEKFFSQSVSASDLNAAGEATRRLYGWDIEEFKKFVLLPQARLILLSEELQKDNVSLDSWMGGAVKNADVGLYFIRWA